MGKVNKEKWKENGKEKGEEKRKGTYCLQAFSHCRTMSELLFPMQIPLCPLPHRCPLVPPLLFKCGVCVCVFVTRFFFHFFCHKKEIGFLC